MKSKSKSKSDIGEKGKGKGKGKGENEEHGGREYEYVVDEDRGIARLPCEVDVRGKIHLPKLVRQRLGILDGAEVKVVLEVVRRYGKGGV